MYFYSTTIDKFPVTLQIIITLQSNGLFLMKSYFLLYIYNWALIQQTYVQRDHSIHRWNSRRRLDTHKSRGLPAVARLDVQRHLEQVVAELLLAHVPHRVQVLEEPLRAGANETRVQVAGSRGGGRGRRRGGRWGFGSPGCRAPPSGSRAGSGTAGSRP